MKTKTTISILTLMLLLFTNCKKEEVNVSYLTKVQLGKSIFNNTTFSNPVGQSCASCHSANAGFADPTHASVSPGINVGLFGNRNAPTAAYAMYTPSFYNDGVECYGGQFWDGRVNTLEEQAVKPFFNPLEMNITNLSMFVSKVKSADFYPSFVKIYGESSDEQKILTNIGDAIAAFERSPEVNPFSSKYDAFTLGKVTLTAQETAGLKLFNGAAKCASCHFTSPDGVAGKALFTDFKYHNIGVPRNPLNPFYKMDKSINPDGDAFQDLGLGGVLKSSIHNGEFKCSTLRNIALTAPYFHNGVYNTLEEVVHFYNARDVDPTLTKPEVSENLNKALVGNLKLTADDEAALVAFMKTLTDGYKY